MCICDRDYGNVILGSFGAPFPKLGHNSESEIWDSGLLVGHTSIWLTFVLEVFNVILGSFGGTIFKMLLLQF